VLSDLVGAWIGEDAGRLAFFKRGGDVREAVAIEVTKPNTIRAPVAAGAIAAAGENAMARPAGGAPVPVVLRWRSVLATKTLGPMRRLQRNTSL